MKENAPLLLGLDAGGSGTKWALWRVGEEVKGGRTAPLTTALLETASGAAALDELRRALPEQPLALHAGVPGLSADSARATQVAVRLAGALDLDPRRVSVEGDLDLAYRAHWRPGEGLLVYAGTGSIAYHVTAAGQALRAGGRGYRIGDDGGGASIGRMALRWVTDQLDVGQVPTGPLADELAGITGGLDWDTLRAFVYGVPGASALAKLVPAVSQAAEQGDEVALALLDGAAQSLAELATRLQQQVGPLPVIATGGVLRSAPLRAALLERLPGARVQFRDHALAAAEVAAGLVTDGPTPPGREGAAPPVRPER